MRKRTEWEHPLAGWKGREYMRALHAKLRAAGLCPFCRSRTDDTRFVYCYDCRLRGGHRKPMSRLRTRGKDTP